MNEITQSERMVSQRLPSLESPAAFPRPILLHAHLLFLAQPGRDLVCQDRTRSHRARHLLVGLRLSSQTPRYINDYSAHARPIQWKYSDPARRVRRNEVTATGQGVNLEWVSVFGLSRRNR